MEKAQRRLVERWRLGAVSTFRAPESSEILADNRRKHDSKMTEQFLINFNVGIVNEDIRKVFRLGRRNEDQSPRPILVQLGSRHIKNMVMESLNKMKS